MRVFCELSYIIYIISSAYIVYLGCKTASPWQRPRVNRSRWILYRIHTAAFGAMTCRYAFALLINRAIA